MVQNVLNQIANLNRFEKAKLVSLLWKTPANRDVADMIRSGKKSVEGTGVFANNGLSATVLTNIRSRILIADLPLLRDAIFKTAAGRSAYVAMFRNQPDKSDPNAS
jgi:hypothetical protein